MSDLLLDVPESTPKWRELAERHGIFTHHSKMVESDIAWSAWDFRVLEGDYCPNWRQREPMDIVGEYCALIEERGGIEYAPTEREAAIALIHRLKLDGWQEVSL